MTAQEAQTPAPAGGIAAALADLRARIAAAEKAAGRPAGSVSLVAVSKTQPVAAVEAALRAGQRLFGENRVQEAKTKFPEPKARHPDLALHLIGPLQTNKVREALALFDAIETLDRPKLAAALAAEIAKLRQAGAAPRTVFFVQVNTGEEPQKAGIAPGEADAFIALCRDTHGLNVQGLMCIPPVDEEPSLHFALLAQIAKRNGLAKLSMGMSADFDVAIAFGATHVRIGTAVFGARRTAESG